MRVCTPFAIVVIRLHALHGSRHSTRAQKKINRGPTCLPLYAKTRRSNTQARPSRGFKSGKRKREDLLLSELTVTVTPKTFSRPNPQPLSKLKTSRSRILPRAVQSGLHAKAGAGKLGKVRVHHQTLTNWLLTEAKVTTNASVLKSR